MNKMTGFGHLPYGYSFKSFTLALKSVPDENENDRSEAVGSKGSPPIYPGTVAPRPIAFASTVDAQGVPNLAPYSFFNAFSSNPPVLVFSSNRKVNDNQTKDTLHNIRETGEVVINSVNFS
ncbi:MAG: flavin reductase [Lewinellaceae bacterium]|nr:flavin reductase [Lewinellaceae bacterium]